MVVFRSDKRCFGTYFRVHFFGTKFGELDGQEYVYKEPSITKLAEISSRLEEFYTLRFGHGAVEVLKDSNDVRQTNVENEPENVQKTFFWWDTMKILKN